MAKSMSLNSAAGLGGMLKDGHKVFEGVQGAVIKNIEAARAIAGMVQTSLGPNGMNKLVVNHLGKMIVTSDCATIMKELEVQHPAARMLVLASEMQESEFGDNTNFVSLTFISTSTASNMISSLIQGYSVILIFYLSSSVLFLFCR
jgi:T-complex protein 1 subunit theta